VEDQRGRFAILADLHQFARRQTMIEIDDHQTGALAGAKSLEILRTVRRQHSNALLPPQSERQQRIAQPEAAVGERSMADAAPVKDERRFVRMEQSVPDDDVAQIHASAPDPRYQPT
jgi:hypothetical protein